MSKSRSSLPQEKVAELEKELKTETEKYNNFLREKKELLATKEALELEIKQKLNEIHLLSKGLTKNNRNEKDEKDDGGKEKDKAKGNDRSIKQKQITYGSDEQIIKHFSFIQKACNANIKDKYNLENMDQLVAMQKNIKLTYIIIKKLEIKEMQEIQVKFEAGSKSVVDQLKSLEKAGKLSYHDLKESGPIFLFRITAESKFVDLKQMSCYLWEIPEPNYSLYDDSFNNLECCKSTNIQQFFKVYQPYDNTLYNGQTCFYLIEKMKTQKRLLQTQARAIDSKAEIVEEAQKQTRNATNDIDNCISMLKDGKILRGLDSFKIEKSDAKQRFMKNVKLVDNNIIYIILALVLIAISMYSIILKNFTHYYNGVSWENKVYVYTFT